MSRASHELPDCSYLSPPTLIKPQIPTPRLALYLSNLDDQPFLRFTIKYLYLFSTSSPSTSVPTPEALRLSLSKVLVEYYPLAGRLRHSPEDEGKLEVDCNGEGAVFVEGAMEITAEDFLGVSRRPNRSWRKLLHRVDARSFLDVPPLLVQVWNSDSRYYFLPLPFNSLLQSRNTLNSHLSYIKLSREPADSQSEQLNRIDEFFCLVGVVLTFR